MIFKQLQIYSNKYTIKQYQMIENYFISYTKPLFFLQFNSYKNLEQGFTNECDMMLDIKK